MREANRDKGRIQHILYAINKIEEYTHGLDYDTFKSNSMCVHATIYNIQIIGEATYMLTKEFKNSHPSIPWNLMEKMRHILVHDYYRIKPEIVWDVIIEDIPSIKPALEQIVK